jgi:hypothetical protein
MLTLLGGLAEFERELIRARTGEGRERVREWGGIGPRWAGPHDSLCPTFCAAAFMVLARVPLQVSVETVLAAAEADHA